MASAETIDQTIVEQRSGNSIAYSVGGALLGDRWLMAWQGVSTFDIKSRLHTAKLSKELLHFVNDLDDVIDAPGLDLDGRLSTLHTGADHLLGGKCSCPNECSGAMQSALALHHSFVSE